MFKRYLIGFFKDEGKLLAAVRALRSHDIKIMDVYSPYAIHGIDEAMNLRRSRLAWVTFVGGVIALAIGMYFQFYTSVIDWPIDVGGKPHNSTLAFLPIAFEITVLLAGLSTVAAFFLRGRLYPWKQPKFNFPGVTDDTFALVLEHADASFDEAEAEKIMLKFGALDVESKVISQ